MKNGNSGTSLNSTELKYPDMRDELLEYLLGLSDIDYQIEKWIQYNPKDKIKFDCLNLVIHFIFDDTVLGEAPEKAIGFFLLNKREADAVRDVVRNLDIVLKKYGMDKEDSFYIQTDEWRSVLNASKKAYSLISNDAA